MMTVPGASRVSYAITARRSRSGTTPEPSPSSLSAGWAGASMLSDGNEPRDAEAKPRTCALAALERRAGASSNAPAKISALVARGDGLRLLLRCCVMCRPDDAHHADAVQNKRHQGSPVPSPVK